MDSSFSIQTSQFQGPLDLLLTLIQERKLYINEISLSQVTDAYLSYLEQCPELPVGETAQFVLVAATLLLIKSRSLLPNLELTDEEESQIEDLEWRLALYRTLKLASKNIGSHWCTEPLFFAAKQPSVPIIFSPSADITLANVESAMCQIIAGLPNAAFTTSASVRPLISLQEVIQRLEDRIRTARFSTFNDLVKGQDKHDTVVQFLAVLELVRRGSLIVEQRERFGDMMLQSEHVSTPNFTA